MKLKELKQKTDKELNDLFWENRKKLGEIKFASSTKKLKNVKEIRELKREIARIITILRERLNNKNNENK